MASLERLFRGDLKGSHYSIEIDLSLCMCPPASSVHRISVPLRTGRMFSVCVGLPVKIPSDRRPQIILRVVIYKLEILLIQIMFWPNLKWIQMFCRCQKANKLNEIFKMFVYGRSCPVCKYTVYLVSTLSCMCQMKK